ncbi:PucR family transcriptional regulator [Leucobacter denitrificans]|uniref:PucR family transcriptional regulator ligand-binding domain-containing protein n=1 Tax=Leucobacter denitrificans TaxID=683042 RepID=A0A7G9S211_9MICO|nr:PucR family transcriptional regulator [Leucobacter denitrificans]QNN61886.1 PucR family transcriptional regulator ligand-binding domain-containing protein [Leucobacter denitrificans]
MTLGELVSIDTLHTHVIAGASGLDRRVQWAHSCELDEPWKWLGTDELLMTVGFCVPKSAAKQVEFVRELSRAGIVGAMIGARIEDLTLSPEMLEEANQLGFPIMNTAPEVPWSAVARHVAAATSASQTSQVMTLAKLYELTAMSANATELARNIATLLRIELTVHETESGLEIMSSRDHTTTGNDEGAEDDSTVSLRVRTHELSSRFAASLEVGEYPGAGLGAMVLVHLKRVLEVETDRLMFEVSAQADALQEHLAQLLKGNEPEGAAELFAAHSLGGAFRIIAFPQEGAQLVARAAIVRNFRVLVGRNRSLGIIVAPAVEIGRVKQLLGECDMLAGVSSLFDELSDARSLVSEAESALMDAESTGTRWSEFAGSRIAMLSRSEREAHDIIKEVLGPLGESTERAAVLRDTLFTYLRHERSWNDTSADLGIHRQTLSYRLRQVESLTGRSIAKTEDLAALWIASQAWQKYGAVTQVHG